MKKLLLFILGIMLSFVGFSSACLIQEMYGDYTNLYDIGASCVTINNSINPYIVYVDDFSPSCEFYNGGSSYQLSQVGLFMFTGLTTYCCGEEAAEMGDDYVSFSVTSNCLDSFFSSSSSSSDIDIFYDFGHSFTTVLCNGDNSIYINGMSSYSGYTFTPYFNINYVDQDNQNIIESYNKDILYLSGGLYHKSYTGDNLWVLNLLNNGSNSSGGFNIISSGLVVSGDIVSDNLSGNIFKNFIDTGFTVLFSNIPSYIQYVILIAILILILRAFTKKRRKF